MYKQKVTILGKIIFFLKLIITELSQNDYSTRDSKNTRNYMQPNFMWCQKMSCMWQSINGVKDFQYSE